MLYSADGSVLVPSDQQAQLQSVDPRLSFKFHLGMQAFVVALQWASDDERHAVDPSARALGNDWSIEACVPAHIPLEQLAGWAMAQMARGGETAARMVGEYQRRVERQNDAQTTAIGEAVRNDVFDTVRADRPTVDVGKRRTKVA